MKQKNLFRKEEYSSDLEEDPLLFMGLSTRNAEQEGAQTGSLYWW